MRIEKIRSAGDVGRWVVDQIGHVAIGLVPTALMALVLAPALASERTGADASGLLYVFGVLAAIMVLIAREIVQWSAPKRSRGQWYHLLDPVLDVVIGSAGVSAVLYHLLL